MLLWNAQTGRSFVPHDPRLPLTSVGCVFDDTNVWANVQLSHRPSELSWSLHDTHSWRPFFGGKRGFPPPQSGVSSLQVERIHFSKTPEEHRSNIEREVEDRLQRELEELRGHRPTDWNRSVSATLKKLLRRFEEDAAGIKKLTEAEHDAQLERVRASYGLVGFPLHATYTDIKPLVQKLRDTNLWLSDGPKIQFALSAYVHAYPDNVLSVWVYVATLEDLRAGGRPRVD